MSGTATASASGGINATDPISGENIILIACSLCPPVVTDASLLQICRCLIDAGASVTGSDSHGLTCLHRLARNDLTQVARFLLNKGAMVNALTDSGDTALHIASSYGHIMFIELLMEFCANPHVRNDKGKAAIDVAGSNCLTSDSSYGGISTFGTAHDKKSAAERHHYLCTRTEVRRVMLLRQPRLRTLILYHDDCLAHSVRRPSDWEGPDRVSSIMQRLKSDFQENELELSSEFQKASLELLGRVHSAEYIRFVNTLSQQVKMQTASANGTDSVPPPPPLPFTPQVQKLLKRLNSNEIKNSEYCDTAFSAGTLRAARRAAGAVAHAVDSVLLGRHRNAFCVIRPPGHHAGHEGLLEGCVSCGFCIFNSVAAGAVHALEALGCERVAIVDFDVHHGD